MLFTPPPSGVLVDVTQNYGSAFYSCAVGMAISAVFLGLVKPAKRGLLCRRRNSKQQEDTHEKKGDSGEQSVGHKPDERTDSPEDCPYPHNTHNSSVQDQEEATRDDQEVIRFAWANNNIMRIIKGYSCKMLPKGNYWQVLKLKEYNKKRKTNIRC